MMSIELSDQVPHPPRIAAKPLRRPTPCAGLFGWRKGGAAATDRDKDGKSADDDYPIG